MWDLTAGNCSTGTVESLSLDTALKPHVLKASFVNLNLRGFQVLQAWWRLAPVGTSFSLCVFSCVYSVYLWLGKCQGTVVTAEASGGQNRAPENHPGKSYCSFPCSYFSIMEHSLLEKIT